VRNRIRFGLVAGHVDRMLCVAPHLVAAICARGAPAGRVVYFPNAIETSAFPERADVREREKVRIALGVDESATILLHMGRDFNLKGGDLFLDAFQRLHDDRVIGLMIRGGDAAREEVRLRGLEGRVIVVGGTSAGEEEVLEALVDIRPIYAASDIFLATSRAEGMPLSVLEALSSGLPVVATDIAGHELPGGGPPGFHLAPIDPDAISRATRRILDRAPADLVRDGAESHRWVVHEFGLEAWAVRLIGLYDEMTSRIPIVSAERSTQ
jgi:glycosyltransferase involved in cell wall biosynthesis